MALGGPLSARYSEGTRHGSAGKPNLRDLGRRGCRADQGMDRDEPQGPQGEAFFDHAYGKRPREELYSVKKDPDQMKNLASDPAYANTVKKLRVRLMNYFATTRIPGWWKTENSLKLPR